MKKFFGRVVSSALIICFLYEMCYSGKKVMDGKIGVTVSRVFAKRRLFPSISVCFERKRGSRESIFPDIDATLNQTQDEVAGNIRHRSKFEIVKWV